MMAGAAIDGEIGFLASSLVVHSRLSVARGLERPTPAGQLAHEATPTAAAGSHEQARTMGRRVKAGRAKRETVTRRGKLCTKVEPETELQVRKILPISCWAGLREARRTRSLSTSRSARHRPQVASICLVLARRFPRAAPEPDEEQVRIQLEVLLSGRSYLLGTVHTTMSSTA
jgi:hypothetical protein